MNKPLCSELAPPAAAPPTVEFHEPARNNLPLHFLLLALSLPAALISSFFLLIFRMWGGNR